MTQSVSVVSNVAVATSCTGVSGVTTILTVRSSYICVVIVTQSCGLVSNVGLAAILTGVSGVATVYTVRSSYNCFVVVSVYLEAAFNSVCMVIVSNSVSVSSAIVGSGCGVVIYELAAYNNDLAPLVSINGLIDVQQVVNAFVRSSSLELTTLDGDNCIGSSVDSGAAFGSEGTILNNNGRTGYCGDNFNKVSLAVILSDHSAVTGDDNISAVLDVQNFNNVACEGSSDGLASQIQSYIDADDLNSSIQIDVLHQNNGLAVSLSNSLSQSCVQSVADLSNRSQSRYTISNIAIATVTGVSGVALCINSGSSYNCLVSMTQSVGVISNVAVATVAGVSGVASLSTGGLSYICGVSLSVDGEDTISIFVSVVVISLY